MALVSRSLGDIHPMYVQFTCAGLPSRSVTIA
jgi:hypothetical protein